MKVSCMPSPLASALAAVARVASTRSTLPILGNIVIETVTGGIQLTATNLEVSMRKQVPAEVEREGKTSVPAKLFTDFVASLPNSELKMDLNVGNHSLHLSCGGFESEINGIDPEDFPLFPSLDNTESIVLPAPSLLRAIAQVTIASSAEESRPVLTGVLFKFSPKEVLLVATDGHRLSSRKFALSSKLEADLIVPARALMELEKAMKDESEEIEVLISQARNQIFFKTTSTVLSAQLIDGHYPNWEQVVPQPRSLSTTITAKTAHFASSLKAVSIFARDHANIVRLSVANGKVTLMAKTAEVGDSTAEVEAEVLGDGVEISFNARYLIDALTVVDSKDVEFRLGGPLSPAVVSIPGSQEFLYVVMPVRTAI